jgi:hypothetical protein
VESAGDTGSAITGMADKQRSVITTTITTVITLKFIISILPWAMPINAKHALSGLYIY